MADPMLIASGTLSIRVDQGELLHLDLLVVGVLLVILVMGVMEEVVMPQAVLARVVVEAEVAVAVGPELEVVVVALVRLVKGLVALVELLEGLAVAVAVAADHKALMVGLVLLLVQDKVVDTVAAVVS